MRRAAGLILAAVQLVLALAALGERGERGTAAHVEPEGIRAHAVHVETFCPTCQALLLPGLPAPADRAATLRRAAGQRPSAAAADRLPPSSVLLPAPRAPPSR